MPKLSKDSLEKRFTCKYCGKALRTRQGLSGHIQFKHGNKQKTQQIKLDVTASRAVDMKVWQEALHLPQSTLDAAFDMLRWWERVRLFCKIFDIQLNQQDLKNYLITSLVSIYQNGQLKQQLIANIG